MGFVIQLDASSFLLLSTLVQLNRGTWLNELDLKVV